VQDAPHVLDHLGAMNLASHRRLLRLLLDDDAERGGRRRREQHADEAAEPRLGVGRGAVLAAVQVDEPRERAVAVDAPPRERNDELEKRPRFAAGALRDVLARDRALHHATRD